jgi:threonine dehydrogenase-like Zn-dependent dehydrogenase
LPIPEKSRAAVQVDFRKLELRELPLPEIGPDDGLLQLESCGICGTDVERFHGVLTNVEHPHIPGHEPLGLIAAIGDRAAARWGVRVGDRVAVEAIRPCHHCDPCLAGDYLSCRNRASYGGTPLGVPPALWGSYAEFMYLHPDTNLHKVSKSLPPEIAVMYNPLGAGVRWACHLPQTRLGDTVLVLGAGQRGLSCAIAAKAVGAGCIIVTGLARDAKKLALARELGADFTINVEEEDTVRRVAEITGGALADVVVDVAPYATQVVVDAVAAVRPGGTIVLAGLKGNRPIQNLLTDTIVRKAITIKGALAVDAASYRQAIRIIESGRFPLDKLHTHTFPLAEAARAIETLAGNVPGEAAVHVTIAP